MNSKTLDEVYSRLQKRKKRANINQAYVLGKNPNIIGKYTGKKPDNRICNPLAKVSVESMAGYAGRTGDITIDYELADSEVESMDDPFLQYCKEMDVYNKVELENSELYEEMLEQGVSYEIFWTSDKVNIKEPTTEYKIVPYESVFIQWTDDIKPKMAYAAYVSGDKELMTATIYYPLKYEVWQSRNGGDWVEIKLKQQKNIPKGATPFKTVNINIFMGNRRSLPLFEAEKALIDGYDTALNKSMNEVDRFSAAIALFGESVSEEFKEKLKNGDITVIGDLTDDMSTGSSNLPRYLEKNLGGYDPFVNNILERFLNDYFRSVKVADMTDETMANVAAETMAYKILNQEFKAAQIETYFNQGLKKRLEFYGDVYGAGKPSFDVNDYKAVVKTKRNLPVDLKAKAEVVQMLAGVLSEETLLKILPKSVVDDAVKEIERKATEMPANVLGLDEEGIEGTSLDVINEAEAIALNGAQVQAAQKIASDVAAGLLPRESGIQLIMALGIPREQAEAIVPKEGKKAEAV